MPSSLLAPLHIFVLPIKFSQREIASLQQEKILNHGGQSALSPCVVFPRPGCSILTEEADGLPRLWVGWATFREEADVILTRLLSRKRLTMILTPELVVRSPSGRSTCLGLTDLRPLI